MKNNIIIFPKKYRDEKERKIPKEGRVLSLAEYIMHKQQNMFFLSINNEFNKLLLALKDVPMLLENQHKDDDHTSPKKDK